jgi:allophanate hydrolase subunit 1
LIGRTPLRLFDPNDEENPTLIDAGDWIRFRRIPHGEYIAIKSDADAGKYVPERIIERSGEGGASCLS